jgi:small-conductance mechanosensitive channel
MSSLVIIAFIAWFCIRSIRIYEQYFLQKTYNTSSELHKSAFTKIQVLKKILTILIVILSVIAMLMVFDKARSIGISLLASAGIIGAMITFLAQKPLSALTSGVQMAISHPIEIGDIVVIQKELGTVEKITLSHVVVKLWDLRTLFVPTRFFLEEPFQNWTHNSSALLGTVFLYVDYFISIETMRLEFERLLQQSKLWDGKTKTLQVTEAKENHMELRFLVSAQNSGNLWDLRCYLREKLIKFIRENHSQHFPKIRIEADNVLVSN